MARTYNNQQKKNTPINIMVYSRVDGKKMISKGMDDYLDESEDVSISDNGYRNLEMYGINDPYHGYEDIASQREWSDLTHYGETERIHADTYHACHDMNDYNMYPELRW